MYHHHNHVVVVVVVVVVVRSGGGGGDSEITQNLCKFAHKYVSCAQNYAIYN
jgi:hypothetical protein